MVEFDHDNYHRRSIRLRGYDYSQAGAYFVTMCTQDRACLFGAVEDGEVQLNQAGQTVSRWWDELNRRFTNVRTDASVIMPNHVHGIIVIEFSGGVAAPTDDNPAILGDVVQWFKTMSTNEYIRGVTRHDWPPFPGKLWQRNYYERIIRDEGELTALRQYILTNPLKWQLDRQNPFAVSTQKDHRP
jgi:putative transposase